MSMVDLHKLSSAEVAEAADRNFVVHASWVHAHTSGMRVQDSATILLADSGLECDTFNIICRARFDSAHAAQQIRAALVFLTAFNGHSHGGLGQQIGQQTWANCCKMLGCIAPKASLLWQQTSRSFS